MDKETFQKFNHATTTLRFMEPVWGLVRLNGAKENRKMFAHGFRTCSSGLGMFYSACSQAPENHKLK